MRKEKYFQEKRNELYLLAPIKIKYIMKDRFGGAAAEQWKPTLRICSAAAQTELRPVQFEGVRCQ